MKRILLAVLIAVGLSGCTTFNRMFNVPSNETPVVIVMNGEVKAVDPDPIRFSKGQRPATIYWQAPSGYRFAARNGIAIDGEQVGGLRGRLAPQDEIVECHASADLSEFTCFNKNTKAATYKYTVNLETADGKPLKPLDPSILNGGGM